MYLLELFREMDIVEARVGGLQQVRHLLPQGLRQPAGGRAAAALVEQAAGTVALEAALEALDLPDAEVQGGGHLLVRDLPLEGGLEQARPGYFLSAHRERLPCLHGMTFSWNS